VNDKPRVGDKLQAQSDAVYMPRDCYTARGRAKTRYKTKSEAKRALKQMVHRSHTGGPMQRDNVVYRCDHCDFFHIGHNR
jgi:hypothetical protein